MGIPPKSEMEVIVNSNSELSRLRGTGGGREENNNNLDVELFNLGLNNPLKFRKLGFAGTTTHV